MEIVDMQRRLNVLTDLYLEETNPDERSRLEIQMRNYRDKIERAELEQHLMSLEFELRYESDRKEKDEIANQRDAVARKLDQLG